MGESIGAAMRAAALIIARNATARAAVWSVQVPPSIKVSVRGSTAVITSAAGPSYPDEVPGVRHPVFGNRRAWVTNKYRPFLAPATDAKADAATARIAKYIDGVCHDAGFKGTG